MRPFSDDVLLMNFETVGWPAEDSTLFKLPTISKMILAVKTNTNNDSSIKSVKNEPIQFYINLKIIFEFILHSVRLHVFFLTTRSYVYFSLFSDGS